MFYHKTAFISIDEKGMEVSEERNKSRATPALGVARPNREFSGVFSAYYL